MTKTGTGVYDIVLDTDRVADDVKCTMTPVSATPVLVTYVITQLAVPPDDIAGVTVYTWDATGAAADAAFSLIVDLEP